LREKRKRQLKPLLSMQSSALGNGRSRPLLRDIRQRTFRLRFRLAFGYSLSAFSRWE